MSRPPPHDLSAEAAVLSAIILDVGTLDSVRSLLPPECFYSPQNKYVYEACCELSDTGKPIDSVTLTSLLNAKNRLTDVGGIRYLIEITDATPAISNVVAHARIIAEKWRIREVIKTCQRIAAEGYDEIDDVQTWISDSEQRIFDLARMASRHETTLSVGQAADEALKKAKEARERKGVPLGVCSGIRALDKMTGGFKPGELILIGARPGIGKTSLATQIALSSAHPKVGQPFGALFFSLEMAPDQIGLRMLCSLTHTDLTHVKNGIAKQGEWDALEHKAQWLHGQPIWIDRASGKSLSDLRGCARRYKALCAKLVSYEGVHCSLGLVVVDYLQIMEASHVKGRNREQEVAALSRGLKMLAQELDVSVLALSQINRKSEERDGNTPHLSDLRESGALEQDADMVLFIGKEDSEDLLTDPRKPVACKLLISKHRNGPVGSIDLMFHPTETTFREKERTEAPDPVLPFLRAS